MLPVFAFTHRCLLIAVAQLLLPNGIEELVRTNEPPTDLHAASVKDCIEEQARLLERSEKEVEDLIEHLHAKRQQVAKIKLGIQACKRVLELSKGTTILLVPTEVLRVIFHHSLPTTLSACFKHPSNYYANPPFSLVQVCRRWRAVALDMPSLWTFLSIRNRFRWSEEILNTGAEWLSNFVKEHFQRSGNFPKSVASLGCWPTKRLLLRGSPHRSWHYAGYWHLAEHMGMARTFPDPSRVLNALYYDSTLRPRVAALARSRQSI